MGIGVIKSTDAGFFSNFRGTVYTFHQCEQLSIEPYVLWDSGLYIDINKGNNYWEYYFEQIGNPNDINKRILTHDMSWNRKDFCRERTNNLINKYVKIKPHIQEKINSFWTTHVNKNNVLGVHLRLTDKHECHKYGEPYTGKPIHIDKYIKHINVYLEKNKNVKIFLATDSLDYIEELKKLYGNKIFFRNDVIRSIGLKSVHHDMKGDGYKKGEDVLIDTILLSKCNFLFKGISNVATCALFWNSSLNQFNLNEYYNNDMRESFIKQNLDYV